MRFSETVKGEKSITGVPMEKRDLIAVICPCINGPVSEIIRGISSQAMTCNTDTAVFSVLSDTDNENKNRRCEENIYSLINFDMVSGVIFLEEEFWSERLRGMITDACFACGFSNLSHFYHLFRNKFDCSPKKYKEKSTEEN